MRVIFETARGVDEIVLNDDCQIIPNEPHGWVRVIERVEQGTRSWYFNMTNVVALGPDK